MPSFKSKILKKNCTKYVLVLEHGLAKRYSDSIAILFWLANFIHSNELKTKFLYDVNQTDSIAHIVNGLFSVCKSVQFHSSGSWFSVLIFALGWFFKLFLHVAFLPSTANKHILVFRLYSEMQFPNKRVKYRYAHHLEIWILLSSEAL